MTDDSSFVTDDDIAAAARSDIAVATRSDEEVERAAERFAQATLERAIRKRRARGIGSAARIGLATVAAVVVGVGAAWATTSVSTTPPTSPVPSTSTTPSTSPAPSAAAASSATSSAALSRALVVASTAPLDDGEAALLSFLAQFPGAPSSEQAQARAALGWIALAKGDRVEARHAFEAVGAGADDATTKSAAEGLRLLSAPRPPSGDTASRTR